MPFTPFHMGFGMVSKATAGNRMGLISFGMAQVLMDVEPGLRMAMNNAQLHGWSHTLFGAIGIGALAIWCSRWLTTTLVNRWNAESKHYGLDWLCVPAALSYRVLAVGAFLGTTSHVALDSLIHSDMQPLAPFSSANPLLGLMPHDSVYNAMVVCGCIGAICWVIRNRITNGMAR